jgi:outer membrane protein TolC
MLLTYQYLKKPTVNRFSMILTVLVFTILMWPAGLSAQQRTWTVSETVAHVLANPARAEQLRAEQASLAAGNAQETAHPLPRLGIDQELVFGNAQVGYTQLTVRGEQQFDLSSWRSALREAAPHRRAALEAYAAQRELEDTLRVKHAFYEVRYREERQAVFARQLIQLERAVQSITARAEVGDASTYEQRRIERERRLILAQRELESMHQMEAWSSLQALTLWSDDPKLVGELRPQAGSSKPRQIPGLVALERERHALQLEREAWGSPMLRDWTLSAGYRYADVGGSIGHGFIVSLSLPLALWSSDQPRQDRLMAEYAQVDNALKLEQQRLSAAQTRAKTRMDKAIAALEQHKKDDGDAQLVELSELAYSSGEFSLVELLDIYRSETEMELTRIDLEWEARRSALELERVQSMGDNQ